MAVEHAKTVRVVIDGRVQGVWYRGWTLQQATGLGLAGWVRNLSGGHQVEAVFHGPAATVDAMIEACRQGPPAARVEHVHVEPWTETVGHGFHQRPTL